MCKLERTNFIRKYTHSIHSITDGDINKDLALPIILLCPCVAIMERKNVCVLLFLCLRQYWNLVNSHALGGYMHVFFLCEFNAISIIFSSRQFLFCYISKNILIKHILRPLFRICRQIF